MDIKIIGCTNHRLSLLFDIFEYHDFSNNRYHGASQLRGFAGENHENQWQKDIFRFLAIHNKGSSIFQIFFHVIKNLHHQLQIVRCFRLVEDQHHVDPWR